MIEPSYGPFRIDATPVEVPDDLGTAPDGTANLPAQIAHEDLERALASIGIRFDQVVEIHYRYGELTVTQFRRDRDGQVFACGWEGGVRQAVRRDDIEVLPPVRAVEGER